MSVVEEVTEAPVEAPTIDPVTELLKAAQMHLMAGWCQGRTAIDKHGLAVMANSPSAVAVCASGALWRARLLDVPGDLYEGNPDDLLGEAHLRLQLAVPFDKNCRDAVRYNDTPGRTQQEMVDLFQRAIETSL